MTRRNHKLYGEIYHKSRVISILIEFIESTEKLTSNIFVEVDYCEYVCSLYKFLIVAVENTNIFAFFIVSYIVNRIPD